jgi:hypothetical protein
MLTPREHALLAPRFSAVSIKDEKNHPQISQMTQIGRDDWQSASRVSVSSSA